MCSLQLSGKKEMQASFNNPGSQGYNKENKRGVYYPLMIENYKDASAKAGDNDKLSVNDTVVEKVIFVGRMVAVKKENTKWVMTLEDSTGQVELIAHKLPSRDPKILNGEELVLDQYYKAVCIYKLLGGSAPILVVLYLEKINDPNLITNHLLACAHAALSSKKDLHLEEVSESSAVQQPTSQSQSFDHLQGVDKVPFDNSGQSYNEGHNGGKETAEDHSSRCSADS